MVIMKNFNYNRDLKPTPHKGVGVCANYKNENLKCDRDECPFNSGRSRSLPIRLRFSSTEKREQRRSDCAAHVLSSAKRFTRIFLRRHNAS